MIFGAWYLADVMGELAESTGWVVEGCIDPNPPGGVETLNHVPAGCVCFVAIGNDRLRCYVHDRLLKNGRTIAILVCPSAVISPSATIGPGSYVGENVVVRSHAKIGEGVFLNAGAVVSHHCVVEDHSTMGPNSALGGRSRVGARTLIGVGANIKPGCNVADNVTVGTGAVVVKDVPDDWTVIGNPASRSSTAGPQAVGTQSRWYENTIW